MIQEQIYKYLIDEIQKPWWENLDTVKYHQ
jgi:hypothetical protein